MIEAIAGLHHVTMMASTAVPNDTFYRGTLGLRRVKKTVNFDQPDVYHLYYGDTRGSAGSVMTSFPFGNIRRGVIGTGETELVVFSAPMGSLDDWEARLRQHDTPVIGRTESLGSWRLLFEGPDGEMLALEETDDARTPYIGDGLTPETAIRGFRGVSLRLRDAGPMRELLHLMGYTDAGSEGAVARFSIADGNGADIVDVNEVSDGAPAQPGAGSIHHIAFSVPNDEAQQSARKVIADAGHAVTPVIDRDYFNAIYFRTPGGVLFEIATDTPGFATDEDPNHLGEALKLPDQHEHLRSRLEGMLEPLDG